MGNDRRLLESIIETFKNDNNLSDKFLFESFSMYQLFKNKDIDFEDITSSIVDGGQDGGIDSIIILIDDKNLNTLEELYDLVSDEEINSKTELDIHVFQIKKSESYKEKVFEKLVVTFQDILDYSKNEEQLRLNYNIDLVNKIILLRESFDKVMIKSRKVTLNINYINVGNTQNISNDVKHKADILYDTIKNNISIENLFINYYGSKELREMYIQSQDNELILKYNKQINSTFENGENVAYIAICNIIDYFEFITNEGKIRENILENNVRHFQGNVEVNNGIIKTLQEENDKEFWWLNNGITILANEIVPLPKERLKLKNVQVVNGLQTTYCIYEYFKNLDGNLQDNREIMLKIIITNDLKTIDRIICTTNSQTDVRPAELKATDDLQRDIETYFFSKGYYYDRRKNYYKNMKKDKNNIFSIAKTAQYIETLLFAKPHKARANPTSLLKNDENYKRIFNTDLNIDAYLKACLIFKKVNEFIKEINQDDDVILDKYGASIKNLTFHIMLVSTLNMLNKNKITDQELSNLDLDLLDDTVINDSINILLNILDNLDRKEKIENIINTAKSKALTNEINEYFNC